MLDTTVWLWWIDNDRRLSRRARRLIADSRNEAFFSCVSVWEIAMKTVKGQIKNVRLGEIVETLAADRIKLLDIKLGHIVDTAELPLHHTDPFDRLLIAQARAEGLTMVTGDHAFEAYGVAFAW